MHTTVERGARRRRQSCALSALLGAGVVCAGALGAPRGVAAQQAAAPQPAGSPEREVALPELLAYAQQHAPALRIASAQLGYADAAQREGEPLLRERPTLELGLGPRMARGPDPGVDFTVSLAQPIEIAGERGLRLRVARELRARLRAETLATRWQLRIEIALAYRLAALAREGAAIAGDLVRFADELLALTRRRLAAGEVSAIELRVAEAEAAQAREAGISAQQELTAARYLLCELSGWPLETPPLPRAGIEPALAVPALAALLAIAAQHDPELRAQRAAIAEAEARSALAEREAWPEPVIGAQYVRESEADGPVNHILLGTLGLPLPLWSPNPGEQARARADEQVLRAEAEDRRRTRRIEIARTHAELGAAAERIALFGATVLPSLRETLSLLQRGFEAGEIPLLDLALARERLLGSGRDALTAYADYYRARAALERAIGAELRAAPTAAGGAP